MPMMRAHPDTESGERRRAQVAGIRSKRDTLQEDEEHFMQQCEGYLATDGKLPTAEFGARLEALWKRCK